MSSLPIGRFDEEDQLKTWEQYLRYFVSATIRYKTDDANAKKIFSVISTVDYSEWIANTIELHERFKKVLMYDYIRILTKYIKADDEKYSTDINDYIIKHGVNLRAKFMPLIECYNRAFS